MGNRTDRIMALRREPPAYRRVAVVRTTALTPHLRRITLAGDELGGLVISEPAASVRLLVPSCGASDLVIPNWNGNEFLLPDGHRPLIRTFTPRYLRSDPNELDLDIVLHGDEGVSGWAMKTRAGDPAAVSGPGRGYAINPDGESLLLLGDESAIPAIAQLLEVVPAATAVVVHIEVARPEARLGLPDHPRASVTWHDLPAGEPVGTALCAAASSATLDEGARVWAAGEAAGVQRIRKVLAERKIDRSRTTVRGYWKAGRSGPG